MNSLRHLKRSKPLEAFLILAVFILSFLFLSGCASKSSYEKKYELFEKTVEAYHDSLRWKYYDRASLFVDKDDLPKFEKIMVNLENNLNITDYQIRELVLDQGEERGISRVSVTYYKLPSVSEKTALLEEFWVIRDGKWYLDADFEEEIFR